MVRRNEKDPAAGAVKELDLGHPGAASKVGVGDLPPVSVKARDGFGGLRITFAHTMSWILTDGLPPLSGVPQVKRCTPRAQECTVGAGRKRGLPGKQERSARDALQAGMRGKAAANMVDGPWGSGGGAGSPSSFGRQTAGIEPPSSSISCVKSLYSRMDMPPGGLAVWAA